MTGNIDSKLAQLLNESPHFGTAATDLICYFGSTHNDGGMSNKKTHNSAQTGITLRREFMRRNRSWA
jgi:hypothetical protein